MNDEETREEMGKVPLSQGKGKYKSLEVKKTMVYSSKERRVQLEGSQLRRERTGS